MSLRDPEGVAVPPSGEVRMVLRITSKPRTENDMTTDKKVARRKLSLLELASDARPRQQGVPDDWL